jgi:hypothetical protein
MGKTTIPEEGTRGAFTIYWNDIRSINWFLTTPLEADETGSYEVKTKNIPGHQRRKGPSDGNPVNVSQSNANYLVDPSLKSGNALPGYSFILQTTKNADIDATRQFTLVGRTGDFQQYFNEKMKYETYVYWSQGGRHTLKPSGVVQP